MLFASSNTVDVFADIVYADGNGRAGRLIMFKGCLKYNADLDYFRIAY